MKADALQRLFEESLERVIGERNPSDEELESFAKKMGGAVPVIADDIASLLYKSLQRNSRPMLKERRSFLRQFEKRHCSLWKKAIDLLESYLVAAFELGEEFNRHYRPAAAEEQHYVFECLTRLHARSVHVGWEVLCLLKGGYADGAHARWRTAHEIAVVANFIAAEGQNTAKKYLEHDVVESYRAMVQYQRFAQQLGQEPLTADESRQIEELFRERIATYGESYGSQYGWAAEALGKKNPKFSDIEEASELEHLRPYYRMASHNVHANPKGMNFRLGLADGAELLLAGPSNYGLADPGHGIALSVLQSTVPMLNLVSTIDAVVMSKVMMKYTDAIGEAFLKVHTFMMQHDAE